jgi:hypothetical protein
VFCRVSFLRRSGENGRSTLRDLRSSRHSFSDFAEKIATQSLTTNVKLPGRESFRCGVGPQAAMPKPTLARRRQPVSGSADRCAVVQTLDPAGAKQE